MNVNIAPTSNKDTVMSTKLQFDQDTHHPKSQHSVINTVGVYMQGPRGSIPVGCVPLACQPYVLH